MFASESRHEVIVFHEFDYFNLAEVFVDVLKGLTDPRVGVPVMFLLRLNFRQVLHAFNDFIMREGFDIFEG